MSKPGKIMNMNNIVSIKDDIIVIIKESIKLALFAIISFLVVGTSLLYIFIKFTDIDEKIAAVLTGVVVTIFIVIIDMKKIHTYEKMTECHRRIIKKILNT